MFPAETIILIVDDILAVRLWQRKQFIKMGFKTVLVAEDGMDALTTLRRQQEMNKGVGLIICDWRMPKLNGFELFKILQVDANFKNIPFIMASAESDASNILEFRTAGLKNYLVKWFTYEQLKRRMEILWDEMSEAKRKNPLNVQS